MARDKWIIKNETNRYLSVGDLPKLPALWPNKVVNVLNYYEQDAISNSAALKQMLNLGWLTLTKIKNNAYEQFDNTNDADEAVTTAELTDVDDSNEENIVTGVITVTATSYSALSTDHNILVDDDTAGGTVTINLPLASGNAGLQYNIKKLGSTSNVVVDGNGSETIDGGTTEILTAQYESITIVCDGFNWWIV